MRVGYLVNRYPAVSHSFIRREIAGVEAVGVEVVRCSIGPPAPHLPDPRDEAERALTTVVLDRRGALLAAIAVAALRHPLRTLAAWRLAGRMTPRGWHAPIRRLAYLAEAAWLVGDCRRRGVEHLHVHFGTNPAAVARLAWRFGGVPYSVTVHGPDEFDAPRELDLGGKAADAAFTVGISRYGRSQLMRWAPLDAWPRLAVVRCGVEPAAFAETPSVGRDGFCCVARLSGQKGLPC